MSTFAVVLTARLLSVGCIRSIAYHDDNASGSVVCNEDEGIHFYDFGIIRISNMLHMIVVLEFPLPPFMMER